MIFPFSMNTLFGRKNEEDGRKKRQQSKFTVGNS
jgi:hypothetical protein